MENKKIDTLSHSFDQNTDYQMSLQDYIILIKIHYKLILFFTLIGLFIGLYKNINNIPLFCRKFELSFIFVSKAKKAAFSV